MEYYIMSLDKRIQNKFILQKFPEAGAVEYDTSHADKVREHTMLHTIESDKSAYPDVLEEPLFMVSQKVKEVLELYDEGAIYKRVSMVNMPRKKRTEYHVLLVDRIECLHQDAEFYPDKSIKKLVLDKEKIADKTIFKVKGIGPAYMIVTTDIVESLLRRGCYGIKFTKVESR